MAKQRECSAMAMAIAKIAADIKFLNPKATESDIIGMIRADFPKLTTAHIEDALIKAVDINNLQVDEMVSETTEMKETVKKAKKKRSKTTEPTEKEKDWDAVIDQLTAKLEELNRYLNTGRVPAVQKRKIDPNTPEEVTILREQIKEIRALIRKSEPAVMERLEKSIKILEKRIEEKDILPKVKPAESKKSVELEQKIYEKKRLERNIRMAREALKPKSAIERYLEDPFNAVRAFITGMDLSAVFRQGGVIVVANPKIGFKAFMPMLKAFRSEQEADKINEAILNRPHAWKYLKYKLYLAPYADNIKLADMEESFMTSWIDRIPAVKFLIGGSSRAYTTFLNVIRADAFDMMAESFAKNGELTQEEGIALANFINAATGRGKLGMLENAAKGMNTIFFAPRYASSRFQLALGEPLWKGSAATRKIIGKEYAKYLLGVSVLMAIGMAAGGDPEPDPRSSDFGKLRFGNTRLDPISGFSQVVVLMTRILSGQTKTLVAGDIKPIRGKDVGFGDERVYDIMAKFVRGKFSPMIGSGVNLAAGENVVGEKVTAGSFFKSLFTPLSVRDSIDTLATQGIPKGTALSLLGIVGVSVGTYSQSIDSMTNEQLIKAIRENTYKTTGEVKTSKLPNGEIRKGYKYRKNTPHKGKEQFVAKLREQLKKNNNP